MSLAPSYKSIKATSFDGLIDYMENNTNIHFDMDYIKRQIRIGVKGAKKFSSVKQAVKYVELIVNFGMK